MFYELIRYLFKYLIIELFNCFIVLLFNCNCFIVVLFYCFIVLLDHYWSLFIMSPGFYHTKAGQSSQTICWSLPNICQEPYYGPAVGLSTPRAPKELYNNKIISWSRSRRFSYGFAPYFSCAKLYTFPMVPECAPAP